MGKRLDKSGKKLPKNISLYEGKYRVQYTAKSIGKSYDQSFVTLHGASVFLEEVKEADANSSVAFGINVTVDEYFQDWIKRRERVLRINTIRNNRERYDANIKPCIGKDRIIDVKRKDIENIIYSMAEDGYCESTIMLTFNALSSLFSDALANDVIKKTPVPRKIKLPDCCKKAKNIEVFSRDKLERFLSVAKDYANFYFYSFILYTGVRTSENMALKFSKVDWKKKTITIDETLIFYKDLYKTDIANGVNEKIAGWRFGKPKTESSIRTIELNPQAYEILCKLKNQPNLKDDTPEEFRDLIFLGKRKGMPIKNSTYDADLRKLIKIMYKEINEELLQKGQETEEPEFLSCHDLRHTYATMWLESMDCSNDGRNRERFSTAIKQLSKDLGHKYVSTTTDLYCHVTEPTKDINIKIFSSYMPSIAI